MSGIFSQPKTWFMSTPLSGADLGGGCRGAHPSPSEMTCGFLMQLVFCKKNVVLSGHQSVTPFVSGGPPPIKDPVSVLIMGNIVGQLKMMVL